MKENKNSTNGKKFIDYLLKGIGNAFKTVGHWFARMFRGASKSQYEDDPFAVEKLESPSKVAFKAFFRKKIAVTALVILVLLFLTVLIAPLFVPIDYTTEATLSNMGPNLSLKSVPSELKNNIKSISSYSRYSIGVSNDNEMFMWGETKNRVADYDLADYPSKLEGKGKVAFAAAGYDHCIAITTNGEVIGWGSNTVGQYGQNPTITANEIAEGTRVIEPVELQYGFIDVDNVEQLICGYQSTCIVMKDGNFYCWGNGYSITNMFNMVKWKNDQLAKGKKLNVKKAAFSSSFLFLLLENGKVISSSGKKTQLDTGILQEYNIVDIAADGYSFGAITNEGKLIMTGVFENQENIAYGSYETKKYDDGSAYPIEYRVYSLENDKYDSIKAGIRHYAAVTENDKVYAWGSNFYSQANLNGVDGENVFTGSFQTYITTDEGELVKSYGLSGFLMGSDTFGRDLFVRIIHGGKMTMTIGAIAVIISTIIAIIVGCLSGYFGGWVDMLLMRITEIFSALPFLPFAMMLSVVISQKNIDETTRIIIIMFILGLLSWTGLAKMVRGQVLAEREKEFVIAAKAMGVKETRIAFKHILPNIVSIILVNLTLDFAGCMLTESSLSYLGFGVQQPQPTWGNLLNGCNNQIVIENYWWQWLFPALFLAVATICVNIIGDGLNDVLNPKSSSER